MALIIEILKIAPNTKIMVFLFPAIIPSSINICCIYGINKSTPITISIDIVPQINVPLYFKTYLNTLVIIRLPL